jgi:tetratricopeptide (TPR) repeat protein
MGPLGLFKRKKEVRREEKEKDAPTATGSSLLEELCKGDAELLHALSRTLLIDPERISNEGIDFHTKEAQEFQKKKDLLRARIHFQVAGELALYEGKLTQARELFKKCAELESDPDYKRVFEYYSKKANAEKAFKVAQEYYSRIMKSTKREAA